MKAGSVVSDTSYDDTPAQPKICIHDWVWISPAGTSNSAHICMWCHEPDADWLNNIVDLGVHVDYQKKAMILVVKFFNDHVDKTDHFAIQLADVYVVWFSKTLQNYKVLISTVIPDGMYYEVTYNGDKKESYIDAYKKIDNVCVPD